MAVNIAIFASGGGSNALKIIEHFENNAEVAAVRLLVVNKEGIGATRDAKKSGEHNIPDQSQNTGQKGHNANNSSGFKQLDAQGYSSISFTI